MNVQSMSAGEAARSLRARYDAHREAGASGPHLRDAAKSLGTTELELLAASCGDRVVRRLAPDATRLYRALPELGEVKTMTRSDHAVLEKWGTFESVEVDEGPLGQVVGEEIDLRLFLRQVGEIFAVTERGPRGERWSFQVFDRYGDASQKIYLESEQQRPLYESWCAVWAHPSPEAALLLEAIPEPRPERSDEEVDRAALGRGLDAMTNTHEFFGLLREHGVTRTQALRLGGDARARPVDAVGLEHVLSHAATTSLPIMLFVGSRGCLQIHSGTVGKVVRASGYLNVLDPRMNLHVREGSIASAYVVRKPTEDGIVTSFELFDGRGDTIALLFGVRKPGQAESPSWRALAEALS